MTMTTQEATTTADCRAPGCTNAAKSTRGLFAYLCETHIEARRRGELAGRTPPVPRTPADGSLEAKVRELGKLGRDADRAREKARRLTEQALAAKRSADELDAQFRARTRELMGDHNT